MEEAADAEHSLCLASHTHVEPVTTSLLTGALTHFNSVCKQSQLRTERSMCGGLGVVCVHRPLRKRTKKSESGRICPWALIFLWKWLCDRMCPCLYKKMEDNTYKAILQNCSKAQSTVTPFSPGLYILQADHPLLRKPDTTAQTQYKWPEATGHWLDAILG